MLQLFDTLYSFDYDGDLAPYLMAEEKEDYQMALGHQRRAQAELEQRLSREERKWLETLLCNQEDAARQIGIAYSTYRRYEQGGTVPDLLTASKLADFFEVSLDFLAGRIN